MYLKQLLVLLALLAIWVCSLPAQVNISDRHIKGFIENKGQIPNPEIKFYHQHSNYSVLIGTHYIYLSYYSLEEHIDKKGVKHIIPINHLKKIQYAEQTDNVEISGREKSEYTKGKLNYFEHHYYGEYFSDSLYSSAYEDISIRNNSKKYDIKIHIYEDGDINTCELAFNVDFKPGIRPWTFKWSLPSSDAYFFDDGYVTLKGDISIQLGGEIKGNRKLVLVNSHSVLLELANPSDSSISDLSFETYIKFSNNLKNNNLNTSFIKYLNNKFILITPFHSISIIDENQKHLIHMMDSIPKIEEFNKYNAYQVQCTDRYGNLFWTTYLHFDNGFDSQILDNPLNVNGQNIILKLNTNENLTLDSLGIIKHKTTGK